MRHYETFASREEQQVRVTEIRSMPSHHPLFKRTTQELTEKIDGRGRRTGHVVWEVIWYE